MNIMIKRIGLIISVILLTACVHHGYGRGYSNYGYNNPGYGGNYGYGIITRPGHLLMAIGRITGQTAQTITTTTKTITTIVRNRLDQAMGMVTMVIKNITFMMVIANGVGIIMMNIIRIGAGKS